MIAVSLVLSGIAFALSLTAIAVLITTMKVKIFRLKNHTNIFLEGRVRRRLNEQSQLWKGRAGRVILK